MAMCAMCGLAIFVLGGAFTPKASATGPIAMDCDRACLEGLATQYLSALVAHDPKTLPLAKDVKYTENDQVMDVGDGFWGTATAVGGYKHCFADPVVEQIGCMVTMHEGDHVVIMGMRLRVELGRITEIETTYYRQGGGGPSNAVGLDTSQAEPLWFDVVPAAKRVSRQQLITTANMYFAGLENNDGKGVYPFADDCDRMENGIHTTNNPTLSPNAPFNAFAHELHGAVQERLLRGGHADSSPAVSDRGRGARHRVGVRDLRSERHGADDSPHKWAGRVDEELQPAVEP